MYSISFTAWTMSGSLCILNTMGKRISSVRLIFVEVTLTEIFKGKILILSRSLPRLHPADSYVLRRQHSSTVAVAAKESLLDPTVRSVPHHTYRNFDLLHDFSKKHALEKYNDENMAGIRKLKAEGILLLRVNRFTIICCLRDGYRNGKREHLLQIIHRFCSLHL